MDGRKAVDEAVDRLERASAERVPVAPVRDLIATTDITAAYRIQSAIIAHRIEQGAVRVGRKIGLTSAAVQDKLGVSQADYGVLINGMAVADGGAVPLQSLLQPKVEDEIAFLQGADLGHESSRASVRAAIASVHAAIEIVDAALLTGTSLLSTTIAGNAA